MSDLEEGRPEPAAPANIEVSPVDPVATEAEAVATEVEAEPAAPANIEVSPVDPVATEAEAVATEVEAELAAVDRALARLAAHEYGRCERCGEPIPAERLEADPTELRCPAHAAGTASALSP